MFSETRNNNPPYEVDCVHKTKQKKQVMINSAELTKIINKGKCFVGTTSALI